MNSDNENWKPCPEGTLRDVQSRQQRQENSSVMTRRIALGIVASAGVSLAIISRSSTPRPQQLTCDAVFRMAPEYVVGRLDEQNTVSLEAHLKHCPKCEKHIQHLQNSSSA